MLQNKEKGMTDRNINYRCHDDDQSFSQVQLLPVIQSVNQGDWFRPKEFPFESHSHQSLCLSCFRLEKKSSLDKFRRATPLKERKKTCELHAIVTLHRLSF